MTGRSLSVIIPTFRRVERLLLAVASALHDDIADIEVIVVDDSPEQSAREAIAELNDARVSYHVMETPTGGQPALVRNHAIELATGSILYFLDDDDRVLPGALTDILRAFDEHPDAGVVFGTVVCEGPDRVARERYQQWFDWAATTARRLRRSTRLTVGAILFRGTIIINSTCAVRRSVAVDAEGYDSDMAVYEDVDFFMRSMRSTSHVFLDRPVLCYRTGEESIIHDLDGESGPIEESSTVTHQKYRQRWGTIEYRVLQIAMKLLPLGSPYPSQDDDASRG